MQVGAVQCRCKLLEQHECVMGLLEETSSTDQFVWPIITAATMGGWGGTLLLACRQGGMGVRLDWRQGVLPQQHVNLHS